MKRLKPKFRVYYETRLRHPLKSQEDLVYITEAGERFRDVGSPHSAIILCALFVFIALTLGIFYWTKYGFLLIFISGVFLLILHRVFRYFWTYFERVDAEGELIDDKSLLYAKKRRQRSDAFWEFADLFGCTKPTEDIKYSKYKGWQKALIFLETIVIFGMVFALPIATANSPYSRLCSIEVKSIPFYDNPNVEVYYSKDPIIIDYDYGKIPLKQNADTLLQVYEEVRLYINTFCPEAEITDYAVELYDGEIKYCFTFKNFRRGLLYREAYKIISVDVNPDGNWMRFDYYGYYAIENWFGPIKPPKKEIDAERIVNLILQKTGLSKDAVKYYRIGTHFQFFDSLNMSDPSGDTWAAYISCGDLRCFYTVNLAENTVIQEDYAW